MAGPEPSEIYAAAALCLNDRYLDNVVEGGIPKLIEDFFPVLNASDPFSSDLI